MVEQQYNGINAKDIHDALRGMGYGTATRVGYAISITKATGKVRKFDSQPRYEVVGSCTMAAYKRITRSSNDAQEAARAIVAECTGKTYSNQAQDFNEQVQAQKRVKDEIQAGVQAVLNELGLDKEALAVMRARKMVNGPSRPPRARKAASASAQAPAEEAS